MSPSSPPVSPASSTSSLPSNLEFPSWLLEEEMPNEALESSVYERTTSHDFDPLGSFPVNRHSIKTEDDASSLHDSVQVNVGGSTCIEQETAVGGRSESGPRSWTTSRPYGYGREAPHLVAYRGDRAERKIRSDHELDSSRSPPPRYAHFHAATSSR